MKATELLQEIRKMRGAGLGPFKQAYEGWHSGELTQTEAARLLGMCERSFHRKGDNVAVTWPGMKSSTCRV